MLNPTHRIIFKTACLAGLAWIAWVAVLSPHAATACSCAPPPPPNQALEEATAVFAGEVTNLETNQGQLDITLAIQQVWKGDLGPTVAVQTPSTTAMCGYSFELGRVYLVYASDRNGRLQTNQCSRTTRLSQATDDLCELSEH